MQTNNTMGSDDRDAKSILMYNEKSFLDETFPASDKPLPLKQTFLVNK